MSRERRSFAHSFIDNDERLCFTETVFDNYAGEGLIVDGGCFAGSSTRALCEGIKQQLLMSLPSAKIIALDRFLVTDVYVAEHFAANGLDIRGGESFLSIFMENLLEFLPFIEIRAGELIQVGRIASPIEILAVDIAKSPALNSYILMNWFRRLMPGRSLVIQQDFYAPSQPWLAVCMGLLLDYFVIYQEKVGETAIFRLERDLPCSVLQDVAKTSWRSPAGLHALERMIGVISERNRPPLLLMKALIQDFLGESAKARAQLTELVTLDPQPNDKKWEKWLALAMISVDPKAFATDRLFARLYVDYACHKLGEWR